MGRVYFLDIHRDRYGQERIFWLFKNIRTDSEFKNWKENDSSLSYYVEISINVEKYAHHSK